MQELTLKQAVILLRIRGHMMAHGYPPTLRQMAKDTKMSFSGMYCHYQALVRKGLIRPITRKGKFVPT